MRSFSRIGPCAVSTAAIIGVITLAAPARAEGWLTDAHAGAAVGVEGGDPGTGDLAWRRARTRIIAGFQVRSDEHSAEGIGGRAFVEIEQRAALGGELRYSRWITPALGVHAGLIGTIAPETLFGGTVGAQLMIPLGKRAGVFIEPSLSALPLGSDLPEDNVLIWVLVSGGISVSF